MIATGTDDVDDHRQAVLDVQTSLAHSPRRTDDFVDAFPFAASPTSSPAACDGV